MTLYDEINLLMEKLTAAWGSVMIQCAPKAGGEPGATTCLVWDGNQGEGFLHAYEAPTLLEALRLAEQGSEQVTL